MKLHTSLDTFAIVAAIFVSFFWMNNRFNEIDRILVRIETVMITKGIMPDTFAKETDK